ncbi:putative ribosome biogenesis GTPase RsgA 1 [Paenibacillus montaniterrae]|uniref:Small ribosomal subunit biogenesis GTPase RsgA n=1 Tax=Paenibacillus montaniterrae TaxID=429341 RepID=A0A919YSL6_9BACL|nr:ribosome small subunit-dependent GTPase A [Paenibacillus montaniterrae]GIP17434.1 putative ribosome biogenesis GTPase RsgA 1 [Paenibacillus montaniterrae]
MLTLNDYGFVPQHDSLNTGGTYARVTAVHKQRFSLITEQGECLARLKPGVYYINCTEEFPTTGDFVEIQYNPNGESLITKTLPRKSKFSRNDFSGHAAGFVKTIKEQTVAANFDYVFIMQSLNHDFNRRRIERYLAQAWQSGAIPVVILTKADLIADVAEYVAQVEKIAVGATVHPISVKTGYGMEALANYLKKGKTIVFLGSSGVGKSSLANTLAGKEVMLVSDIREEDSKGRHTTTHRQLILLDSGVIIIDTPGMRELGMWEVDEGISEGFSDVEHFFGKCRFSDCKHQSEPGCAIKGAIESGQLPVERWDSYLALKKEAAFVEDRAAYLRNKDAQHVALKVSERQRKKGEKRS